MKYSAGTVWLSVRTLPGGALEVWPETLSRTPWLINKSAGGPPLELKYQAKYFQEIFHEILLWNNVKYCKIFIIFLITVKYCTIWEILAGQYLPDFTIFHNIPIFHNIVRFIVHPEHREHAPARGPGLGWAVIRAHPGRVPGPGWARDPACRRAAGRRARRRRAGHLQTGAVQ